MHVIDLVTLTRKKQEKASTRRKPAKVPEWHLTGKKTMQYIKEAQARQEEKQKRKKNMIKFKKAITNAKQSERKERKNCQK